jgi:hypothetical protein
VERIEIGQSRPKPRILSPAAALVLRAAARWGLTVTPLNERVACANVAKLKGQLRDPDLVPRVGELTRQLAEQELNIQERLARRRREGRSA